MKTSDFTFELPEELIAQDPLADRSSSRLLVLDKETGEIIHEVFKNVVSYLKKGDCLVLNDTKVLPARLIGEKEGTGAKIEVLLLKRRQCLGNSCKAGAKSETRNQDLVRRRKACRRSH